MSKLLLAVDSGNIRQMEGKSLAEIEVEGMTFRTIIQLAIISAIRCQATSDGNSKLLHIFTSMSLIYSGQDCDMFLT